MTTRAEDLFASAFELEPEERERFLTDACGDDAELRLEVELMLEDAKKADALFADGSNATSSSGKREVQSITEKEGDEIGPYKLLQAIGEGGFGVVFIAEQSEPIKRKVALKIIKPGMDTKEVITRFEVERQALALMEHPNIARVLDAGSTDTGRPYFAMELVKGVPVTDYCDTFRLDTKQRLELFQDICSAVQHAHQKGIIHRDLKPSNILVTRHDTAKPIVKVIDFGVAKAISQELTEKTLFTAIGQMIGTPQYMSPEQSATRGIDIDTRSDIYSLGVVLYELLTSKTPISLKKLREAGMEEIYRLIREEEPPKPSTRLSSLSNEENTAVAKAHSVASEKLKGLVRGDLDWIVMKALEKDRGRRYESATEFAADIQHYLTNEPVLARPPSASYRLRKFVRRNKTSLATAVLLFAVMLIGMVVSIWQAVRAEQSAAEAKAVLEFFQTKVLAVARPRQQAGGLGYDITLRAALNAAEPQIGEAFVDQPIVEASIRHNLGDTYLFLGRGNAAISQYERAIELREKVLGFKHPDTLISMDNLGTAYRVMGRHDEALALHKETLALKKKVLGSEHPDTLTSMQKLADSYLAAGSHEEAIALHENTLALRKKVLGAEHFATLKSMNNLAISYRAMGRQEEALALKEETLILRKKVSGPEHPDTLASMHNLAISYRAMGRHEEALALSEETLTLQKKVMGAEHPDTLTSMDSLANSYLAAGRHEEALALHKETLPLRKKVSGAEHPNTLTSMHNLAISYREAGRHEEALALHEKTLALQKKVLGAEHPITLASMKNLVDSYLAAGRTKEAEALKEELKGK